MIDATELFERADKAFRHLRGMAEGKDVTPEWARLHAKGTAVANAGAIFRAKLTDVTDANVHAVVIDIKKNLQALADIAEADMVEVDEVMANKEANFRNAIAHGHADGYKLASRYLTEEVQYFRMD